MNTEKFAHAERTNPASDRWFIYRDDGQHLGPMSLSILTQGLADGRIPRDSFASRAGTKRWRPALEYDTVANALLAHDGTEEVVVASPPPPPATVREADPAPEPRPPAPVHAAVAKSPETAPAAAPEKPEAAPEPARLDPQLRLLPLAIFGGCVVVTLVEILLGLTT